MRSKLLLSLLLVFIGVGNAKLVAQNRDNPITFEMENNILEGISEFADTINLESRKYRNVDIAVFSYLDFEKRKAFFSISNLLNHENLVFVNYSHIYYYKNRPVLIRFNNSIDTLNISMLPFEKIEREYYQQQLIKYFDTTVFITGTSKAVIFDISDGQIKKTWLKATYELPVELSPYDNDLILKEQEKD